jgi:hypothetical protein
VYRSQVLWHLQSETKMKSTRSKVSGRSNQRLFLGGIVATSCLGAAICSPLFSQLPPGLPPSTLPTELPTALPPAPFPALPSALVTKAREQAGTVALPKLSAPVSTAPSAGTPRSSGAVQVRLGQQPSELVEPPRMTSSAISPSPASTVSIAIDPILSRNSELIGQTTSPRLPGVPGQASPPVAQGPVKFSLDDEGVVDLGVQRTLNPPTLVQRAPELVRPKKYSVSQVVTAAADANLNDEPAVSPVPTVVQPVADHQEETVTSDFVPAPLPPAADAASAANALTLPKPPESTLSPESGVASPAVPTQTVPPVPSAATTRVVNVEKTYDIEVLGAYTIDPSLPVASVVAQDPETCNVFHNGRMITVVGNKVGSTVIEICGTDQSVRTIGVKVFPTGRLHASAPTELDKMKGMIAQHFPTAKLSFIQQPDGGIQVKGTATSEADARRILELIRKISLVPIHDQIKVSY